MRILIPSTEYDDAVPRARLGKSRHMASVIEKSNPGEMPHDPRRLTRLDMCHERLVMRDVVVLLRRLGMLRQVAQHADHDLLFQLARILDDKTDRLSLPERELSGRTAGSVVHIHIHNTRGPFGVARPAEQLRFPGCPLDYAFRMAAPVAAMRMHCPGGQPKHKPKKRQHDQPQQPKGSQADVDGEE